MECMFEFQNKHGAAYDWSPEEVIYLLSPHRIIGDMDAGVADRQRQFSAALTRQMQSKGGEFDDLITKMLANLSSDLSVFRLAAMVGMSERSFARKFTATMGISPARFVEDLRVDAACEALQRGEAQLSELPFLLGFGNTERMRRAFQRNKGIAPSEYRTRFGK